MHPIPYLNTCTRLYPILTHGGGPFSENTAIPYLNTWGPHPPGGLSLTLLLLLPNENWKKIIVTYNFYQTAR